MEPIKQLAQEFNLSEIIAKNIVGLIGEGNTIPFIARYRKEMTGAMDDQVLRAFSERLDYITRLNERRDDILRLISEQDKLSPELEHDIRKASAMQELEDLYRPYKQKRRTRAQIARERGLEPLAKLLVEQDPDLRALEPEAFKYIDEEKEIGSIEEALGGAMDILAESISDNAAFRKHIREISWKTGVLCSKAKKKEDSVYQTYYDFREPVQKIAGHRILAIDRGEKEGFLSVSLETDSEAILRCLNSQLIKKRPSITQRYIQQAAQDAYTRLIAPSIENEIRSELTQNAQEKAIGLFQTNLRQLLMQPPVKERVILGLDPAYRTGCKLAVVDPVGRVLKTAVIYPTPPQNKTEEAAKTLKQLIETYGVEIIAIGNGTASRESEAFVAGVLKKISRRVYYAIVNESGASVYSASPLGAEEFPNFDVSLRSAVSIAKRLIDPLSELVKIDPKSIGVGQYQHDMNQKRLSESLGGVVESCVNQVGVNLNTASYSLLSHIAGLNLPVSKNIVAFREANGGFSSRAQLLKVPKLGKKTYEQCAGFLRVSGSKNILDETAVHPESYQAAQKLLQLAGYTLDDVKNRRLQGFRDKVEALGWEAAARATGVGVPTLQDIADELLKPGRDIRDELPKPELRSDVLDISDLKPGMELRGTVRNVINFGAFVDIGVHLDGLVHISELCNRFIKHPTDVVKLGDIITVRVLAVDQNKNRISLSAKGLNDF